jgi:serine/threonine-protein kinase
LALHSNVALKLIESTDSEDPMSAQHFLREARLAAGLKSQHVVQIFDYGVAEDTPFIAMELLEGETLRQRLNRNKRLTFRETLKVLQHVARGVERAHQAGIAHRDLKPDNIFIVAGEDEEIIKVLDFGIAKAGASALTESVSRATPTGAVLGTPHYMSPEQALGSKTLDHRTDLWSMGVIGFECLLGQVPFDGDTLGALIVAICTQPLPVPSDRGDVPPGFDAWFARACAREPAERFASPRQMADEFAALHGATGGASEPVAALPKLSSSEPSSAVAQRFNEHTGPALELVRGPRSRHYWRVAGAVLLLSALIGGFASFRALSDKGNRSSAAADTAPMPPAPAPQPSPESNARESISSIQPPPASVADPHIAKQADALVRSVSTDDPARGMTAEKPTPEPVPARAPGVGSKTKAASKPVTQAALPPKKPVQAPVDLGF